MKKYILLSVTFLLSLMLIFPIGVNAQDSNFLLHANDEINDILVSAPFFNDDNLDYIVLRRPSGKNDFFISVAVYNKLDKINVFSNSDGYIDTRNTTHLGTSKSHTRYSVLTPKTEWTQATGGIRGESYKDIVYSSKDVSFYDSSGNDVFFFPKKSVPRITPADLRIKAQEQGVQNFHQKIIKDFGTILPIGLAMLSALLVLPLVTRFFRSVIS